MADERDLLCLPVKGARVGGGGGGVPRRSQRGGRSRVVNHAVPGQALDRC